MAFSSALVARTMSAVAAASKIQTVTVIGSGLMGAGVAQVSPICIFYRAHYY